MYIYQIAENSEAGQICLCFGCPAFMIKQSSCCSNIKNRNRAVRDLCQQEGVSCITKLTKMQKLWDKASISDSGTGQRGVGTQLSPNVFQANYKTPWRYWKTYWQTWETIKILHGLWPWRSFPSFPSAAIPTNNSWDHPWSNWI